MAEPTLALTDLPLEEELTDVPLEPHELVLEDLPVDEGRGIVGKTKDWVMDAARELSPLITQPLGDLVTGSRDVASELAPLVPEEVKDAGAFGLGVLDASDRLSGTAIAEAEEGASKLLGIHSDSLRQRAAQRMAEEGLLQPDGTWSAAVREKLPVSLVQDVLMPTFESFPRGAAAALRNTDSRTAKEVGEVLEGFAPAIGLAGTLWAAPKLDAIANLGFLNLTQKGLELEKMGAQTPGLLAQIGRGERSLAAVPSLGIEIAPQGKVARKVFDTAQTALAKAEMTAPVRSVRKFMTRTPLETLNRAVEDHAMEKAGAIYSQMDMGEELYAKAKALGVDLDSKATKEEFYRFLDNPSLARNNVGAYKDLYETMHGALQEEVNLSRKAGIRIDDKVFPKGVSLPGQFSERYAPRTALPSKMKELRAKVGENEEDWAKAMEFVNGLEGGQTSGVRAHGYQKFRRLESREEMNRMMRDAYQVDDFFHDDPVYAYIDKISEIRQDRADKAFAEKLVEQFGKNQEQLKGKIDLARERVAAQRSIGMIPSGDDVMMASLDFNDVGQIKDRTRGMSDKLESIGKLAPHLQGLEDIAIPSVFDDYVKEALYRPEKSQVMGALQGFQTATKNFMFFTPGFHARNMWESVARGIGVDVGAYDLTRAAAGMMNEGKWAPRLKEYLGRSKGHGLMTAEESAMETALGARLEKAKIKVDKATLTGQNPQKSLFYIMKEMGQTGEVKGFFKDIAEKLKATAKNPVGEQSVLRDNPAFRWSSSVGQNAEMVPKFAYYNKLRDSGYTADEAMRKVGRHFINYDITREATKGAANYIPFMNYQVKNAETALLALAQMPRNVATFAPGGIIERSTAKWGGFDPERVDEYKDLMGPMFDDIVLVNVQRGHDAVMKQKDYLKDLVEKVFGTEPGSANYVRLPTSYHGLRSLTPRHIMDNLGPMVSAGRAMLNQDPFTGKRITSEAAPVTGEDLMERSKVAGQALTDPFIPKNLIASTQAQLDEKFPAWRENLVNLGMDENTVQSLFGDKDSEKARAAARRAMVKFRTLWTGGATEIDKDFMLRTLARLREGKEDIGRAKFDLGRGRKTEKEFERVLDKYQETLREVSKMSDIADDWNRALSKASQTLGNDGIGPEIELLQDEAGKSPE